MIQSFFNGLSGMFNFSRGLNTISNNVSNMNTPGFRGSDSFYRSLNGGDSGYGTSFAGAFVRTRQGEVRQTGNATDLALSGTGYFVLRNTQGEMFYTRAGQFYFKDNVLVDRVTGYEVMAIGDDGSLSNIDVTDVRSRPAQPTTEVDIRGVVNATIPPGDTNTRPLDITTNIKIYDAGGVEHTLKVVMKWDATGEWKVEVSEGETQLAVTNTVAGNDAEIHYNTTIGSPLYGTPIAGFNRLNVALPLPGGTQSIELDFGDPGSTSGTRQATASGSISGARVDGRPVSSLDINNIRFDETGLTKLSYSDGGTEEGERVALAFFADESALAQERSGIYHTSESMPAQYGRAASGIFGRVASGALELSNVDLTQEFADMMIVQRGYQASSRVMSVSNELVEQLYNNSRGG